jgi:glc operon protein GlcG
VKSIVSGDVTVNTQHLALDAAQSLLGKVVDAAQSRNISVGAVVVDPGGNLIAAIRMDGAQLGAIGLATDKAFTSVAFGLPTSRWASTTGPGGTDWGLEHTLGGRIVVIPGGVPVYHKGLLIAGLGVSGAAAEIDELCAREALDVSGLESN